MPKLNSHTPTYYFEDLSLTESYQKPNSKPRHAVSNFDYNGEEQVRSDLAPLFLTTTMSSNLRIHIGRLNGLVKATQDYVNESDYHHGEAQVAEAVEQMHKALTSVKMHAIANLPSKDREIGIDDTTMSIDRITRDIGRNSMEITLTIAHRLTKPFAGITFLTQQVFLELTEANSFDAFATPRFL